MIKINRIIIAISTLLLTLILLINSVFFLDQRNAAVIFQFGEAIKTVINPGLNFKIPFIQNVEFFDNRILHVSAEAKELTASDGKRVIVDAFAKFKINNPVIFYKTVHSYEGVSIRLNKILESSMRKVIGRMPFTTLLTGERANVMTNIRDQVNEESKSFGIQVIDVRILRSDLPKENSSAIYHRMQTEREKEAKQIRAEGLEESARIRSRADKKRQVLLANAYKNAQIIRGQGDAEAMKIYNNTYSIDPEFFKFYKSLYVYKNVFNKNDTSFILSSEIEALKYLNFK